MMLRLPFLTSINIFRGSKRTSRRIPKAKSLARIAEVLEPRLLLTTFFVDDDAAAGGDGSAGSPFATIQAGIDAAAASAGNDSVAILAGTYVENLQVSDASGDLILTGISGNRDTVIIQAANGLDDTIDIVGSFDVLITNLTVTGGQRGIWVHDSLGGVSRPKGGLRVRDTVVKDHMMDGIVAERSGDLEVIRALLTNNNNGVLTNVVGQVTLTDVTAINNNRDGAQVLRSTGVSLSGGTYDDNVVQGLLVEFSGNVSIANASFNRNRDNGIDLRAVNDVTVSGVDVLNNGSSGTLDGLIVTAGGANNVSLTNVNASGNSAIGIGMRVVFGSVTAVNVTANGNAFTGLGVLNSPVPVSIESSQFSGNARHGIDLNGVTSATIDDVLVVQKLTRTQPAANSQHYP
jgi:hypothetical protein